MGWVPALAGHDGLYENHPTACGEIRATDGGGWRIFIARCAATLAGYGRFSVCVLLAFVCAISVFGQTASADERIKVFVSIEPQAYFVERVGGDRVDVHTLVAPGREPHDYEPTPKQLAELATARVLFTVGVPFEETLLKKIRASFKNLRVVDMTEGITRRTMTEEEAEAGGHEVHHKHGKKDAHGHGAGTPDPHVWLDPVLVKAEAAVIYETLVSVDPTRGEEYRRNLEVFQQDLDRLNEKLAAALAPLKGKEFYVFHPAFGYFADRYGVKQVPVEIGGKEPSARHLAQLISRARNQGVRVIFVQPQFSSKTSQTVAREIGGAVVPLDPLAKGYLKNMEDIATKISAAIKQPGK